MATTLTQRALTTADAAAIAALHAAIERAEPVDELTTETDVLEQLTAPSVDLESSSVGVFDGSDLVGYGLLTVSVPAASWKAVLVGGVLPDYTGRGIGRRIIGDLEAMAARDRARDAPDLPGELKVWVDETRQGARRLLASSGYETWRYFFRMLRNFDGSLPVVPEPPGVTIRRYEASDEEELLSASNESFADHWGSTPMDLPRWRAEFSGSSSFRPAHSWVAVIGGEIVGFALNSEFDGDTELRGFRTGYLARIGTLRRARGRGIAAALIGRTLESMAADGYRQAELGVDADSPTGAGRLYERLGFAVADRGMVVGKRF
ncbi:N-acetyltransferase family protein [Nakamurella sp. GG22]